MPKLEQPGRWIPDARSIKRTFSKTVTFYFTKIENSIKQFLTALILLIRVKVLFLTKKCYFFCKKENADISKIKGILVLRIRS